MAKKRSVTRYSVMALLVLMVGGGSVYFGSMLYLYYWMSESGEQFGLGETYSTVLGPGTTTIFYQTPDPTVVESGFLYIGITGPNGDRVLAEQMMHRDVDAYGPPTFLEGTVPFGRPVWRLEVTEPGEYRFEVTANHSEQTPDDRAVINKSPSSIQQAMSLQRTLMLGGLSIVGILFVILYIMHFVTLHKQNQGAS